MSGKSAAGRNISISSIRKKNIRYQFRTVALRHQTFSPHLKIPPQLTGGIFKWVLFSYSGSIMKEREEKYFGVVCSSSFSPATSTPTTFRPFALTVTVA